MTASRFATLDDLDRIAATLADAFADYAWTDWTVPPEGRWDRVRALQRLYLEHIAIPHGFVPMTEDAEAVAAFVPSEPPDLPPSFWDSVCDQHGEHFPRLMAAEALLEPARPPHSWVLAAVGVAPEHQGRGLGTRVITAGLAELDSRAADCLVETSSEANVRLYRRLGWHPAATVETGGPTVWMLRRASRLR